MERRDFLQFLALCSMQSLLTTGCASTKTGNLLPMASTAPVPGDPSAYPSGAPQGKGQIFLFIEDRAGKVQTLRRMDWNNYEYVDYPLPLLYPHSLLQDRNDRDVVYLFEMFGSAVRLDLRTKDAVRIDHKLAREMFYGHAAQSRAGELFVTQLGSDLTTGVVSVKETKSLRTIATLPRECDGAHQIVTMPDSNMAACGVSSVLGRGKGGAVTFVDCDTRKVVNRVALPDSISHLFAISKDEIVALSIELDGLPLDPKYENDSRQNAPGIAKAKPTAIYHVKPDGSSREFLNGGLFDAFRFNSGFAKIPHSDLMVTSHIGSSTVIVWDGAGKPKKVHKIPHPGVVAASPNGEEIMVLTAGKAQSISVKTGEPVKTFGGDDYRVMGIAAY
ncbi:MAG: hypothetical protein AAB250_00420, partial [Bdellovibrionota bacterium]